MEFTGAPINRGGGGEGRSNRTHFPASSDRGGGGGQTFRRPDALSAKMPAVAFTPWNDVAQGNYKPVKVTGWEHGRV